MADEQTTAADALSQAAAEAQESQEQEETQEETTEETSEEAQEQVAESEETGEESDEEGLPKDHGKRSDLGRKLSAYHRRMDEIDNKFERIMNYLEDSKPKEKDPLDELDPDEPITLKDVEKLIAARDEKKKTREKQYQDSYVKTVAGLGTDMSQEEYDAVIAEMQNITYNPSDDPTRDAEMNFLRAERAYLRKQSAKGKKENPLKGEKPKGKLGVAASQKTVSKETPKPKLDADAQSYIDFVRKRDGDEKANELLKQL